MEIKELMVGDWVLYDPNVFIEDEYEPYKEIYPTKIESGEEIDLAIEHCYSPIPLTPGILEKNGFIKKAFGYYYNDNEYSVYINITSTCDRCKAVWIESKSNGFSVIIEASKYFSDNKPLYVHELQHALRLCEINKEIEL